MIPSGKPFQTASPAALPKYPNILLGGVAGAGKTAFLGSVGPEGKALIADSEGGSVTYQSAWFLGQPTSAKLENLDIISFENVSNVAELVHAVEGPLDYLIRTKNSDGYSVFALDSLTEFQQRFLSLHQAGDPRQSYGALKDALYSIVLKARLAPVVTVFTARLKAIEDPVLKMEIVRPDVSPAVWSLVSGLFDDIGFLDLTTQGVTSRRVLDFNHRPRHQGKDRHGFDKIQSPTMLELLKRLEVDPTAAPTTPPARPAAPAPRRMTPAPRA